MQRPQEGCRDDWLLWAWILTWRLQPYVYICIALCRGRKRNEARVHWTMHSEGSPDKIYDSQENHLNSCCFNDVICQPTRVFTRLP